MAVASASVAVQEKLSKGPSRLGMLIFGVVLLAGIIFIGTSIARDLMESHLDRLGLMFC
jgi:hypothetical protein